MFSSHRESWPHAQSCVFRPTVWIWGPASNGCLQLIIVQYSWSIGLPGVHRPLRAKPVDIRVFARGCNTSAVCQAPTSGNGAPVSSSGAWNGRMPYCGSRALLKSSVLWNSVVLSRDYVSMCGPSTFIGRLCEGSPQ